MVDKETGVPCEIDRDAEVCSPMVRGDIKPYRSPITGEEITSRSARREDLIKHGCREVDPSERKIEYRNDKYVRANWAAKRAKNNGEPERIINYKRS